MEEQHNANQFYHVLTYACIHSKHMVKELQVACVAAEVAYFNVFAAYCLYLWCLLLSKTVLH